MRKWKRELDFIVSHLGTFGLWAFLSAVGCVLLWVGGGSGWYSFKAAGKPGAPSVASLFALSLAVSGLCRFTCSLAVTAGRRLYSAKAPLPAALLTASSYLLHLGWYAAFCCTRLMLFGGILASLSFFTGAAAVFLGCRTLLSPLLAGLLLLAAEGAVVFVTFSFFL